LVGANDYGWLSLGDLKQCVHCLPHPMPHKPWAMKITLQSRCVEEHTSTYILATSTQDSCEMMLNRFCMKTSAAVLNERFEHEALGDYGSDTNDLSGSIIRALFSKKIAQKRALKLEASQSVARASMAGNKSGRKGAQAVHETALQTDGSVFVGYASAFCTAGKAVANDEGCSLFSIAWGDWEVIKRRQIEIDCERAVQVLRGVALLARTSHRYVYTYIHTTYIHTYIRTYM